MNAAIEAAMIEAACRVLAGRAGKLRSDAARRESTVLDGRGRAVLISSPESVVQRDTAALFDTIREDLREAHRGGR